MAEHIPHPANVPGDFYVEDGCCTMCEVPFTEAPELFGTDQDSESYPHCFVKRQPATPAELDQMVRAIMCAELDCIRYRGRDRLIQLRLIETGNGLICDGLPADLQAEAEWREADRQRQWQESQRRSRPWWRFW